MENENYPKIAIKYGNKDGNGSEPSEEDKEFPGARVGLETLIRRDGIIAEAATVAMANRSSSGVLQRAMGAIVDDKDYRQELKTAFWSSPRKARQWVLAKEERERFGVSIKPLVDDLIAQKAGVKGGLLHDIFEALTHTSFTTNYTNQKKNSKMPLNRNNNDRDYGRVDEPLP